MLKFFVIFFFMTTGMLFHWDFNLISTFKVNLLIIAHSLSSSRPFIDLTPERLETLCICQLFLKSIIFICLYSANTSSIRHHTIVWLSYNLLKKNIYNLIITYYTPRIVKFSSCRQNMLHCVVTLLVYSVFRSKWR